MLAGKELYTAGATTEKARRPSSVRHELSHPAEDRMQWIHCVEETCCNAVLAGLPQTTPTPVQRVQTTSPKPLRRLGRQRQTTNVPRASRRRSSVAGSATDRSWSDDVPAPGLASTAEVAWRVEMSLADVRRSRTASTESSRTPVATAPPIALNFRDERLSRPSVCQQ
jgi:hypothetical protein